MRICAWLPSEVILVCRLRSILALHHVLAHTLALHHSPTHALSAMPHAFTWHHLPAVHLFVHHRVKITVFK